MELRYYGHSSFSLTCSGKHLLFDPFIKGNELAAHIDVDQISVDYVLLSHAHEDHVADAEDILNRTGAKLVSSFEIVTYYSNKGIENGHPMNLGGSWDFEFGRVHYVPAIHSSSFADGSYGGPAGGFVIESENLQIYYAGDTALSYDMKLVGEKFDLDLALLPIGDNFTMDVRDAIKASDLINCNRVVGLHYDTFGFIKIDKLKSKEQFTRSYKDLTLMEIGSSLEV